MAELPNINYFKLTPHKKKNPNDLVTRKYTDDQMYTAIERLTSGKTYRKSVEGLGISLSGLFEKERQLRQGGVMRPPQGPKKKFDETSEKDMAAHLHYCWEIGILRMQDHFAHELVHFMDIYDIENTFPNVIPGVGFFRRFKTENPDVRFPRPSKADEYKYDTMTIEQWAGDNERFIAEYNFCKLCASPKCVFVVESHVLKWKADTELSFDVLIPYNGEGVILQPIVAHSGTISNEVQNEFFPRFDFTHSNDGLLNFNSIGLSLQCICWYMNHFELEFPAVVYFAPEMTECISYATWTFAQHNNIFLRQIQRCIYSEFKRSNLGIFEKFENSFLKKVKTRNVWTPTARLFLNGLFKTCSQCKFGRHLRKGVKMLKLLTVEPQNDDATDNFNNENFDGPHEDFGNLPVNHEEGDLLVNVAELGVLPLQSDYGHQDLAENWIT